MNVVLIIHQLLKKNNIYINVYINVYIYIYTDYVDKFITNII